MPRIYDSASNPLDFCKRCFPKTEDKAFEEYGDVGEGPDDRGNCFGYEDEHPPYMQTDYRCETCSKLLNSEDD